mmetsp:Transcript_100494/g.304945  ORF Transcript_100494/g.304945 Transcript_100494/m.304945 type:complete len:202 (-) Transcript_100494:17-622(-)
MDHELPLLLLCLRLLLHSHLALAGPQGDASTGLLPCWQARCSRGAAALAGTASLCRCPAGCPGHPGWRRLRRWRAGMGRPPRRAGRAERGQTERQAGCKGQGLPAAGAPEVASVAMLPQARRAHPERRRLRPRHASWSQHRTTRRECLQHALRGSQQRRQAAGSDEAEPRTASTGRHRLCRAFGRAVPSNVGRRAGLALNG